MIVFTLEFDGPSRVLKIAITDEEIGSVVQKELGKIRENVRFDGFRKGKVPLEVVKTRYGDEVREREVSRMYRERFDEIVQNYAIKPASAPRVMALSSRPGECARCEIFVEVTPDITFVFEGDTIEYPKVTGAPGDSFILHWLRHAFGANVDVTRPAQHGDMVQCYCTIYLDKPGGQKFLVSHKHKVEFLLRKTPSLFENAEERAYEKALLGHKSSENVNVYHTRNGKDVVSDLEILNVKTKRFNMEDIDTFKNYFADGEEQTFATLVKLAQSNLKTEVSRYNRKAITGGVWDFLIEKNALYELPRETLAEEVNRCLRLLLKDQRFQNLIEDGGFEAISHYVKGGAVTNVVNRFIFSAFCREHEKYLVNGSFFVDRLKEHFGKISDVEDAEKYYTECISIKNAFHDYALTDLLVEDVLRYAGEKVDEKSVDDFVAEYTGL